MSRRKLTDLRQVDGKLHPEDEGKPEITTLDQLFGNTGLNKYKTLNATEYSAELNGMNTADLREHATKMQIIPRDISNERLKKQLLIEFNRFVASYNKPSSKSNQKNANVSKEVLDIMSRAK